MDAQADLGYRCPHMPAGMFLHGAVHILILKQVNIYNYFRLILYKIIYNINITYNLMNIIYVFFSGEWKASKDPVVLSKVLCLTSRKWSTLKGKNLLPRSKFFSFRVDHF